MPKRKTNIGSRATETGSESPPLKVLKLNDQIDENDATTELDEIEKQLRATILLNDNKKFTKENAWTNNAIDLLHIFSGQKCADFNYFLASHCLDVVTRIFALRLDSLFEDTTRLAYALGLSAPIQNEEFDTPTSRKQIPCRNRVKQKVKRRHPNTVSENPELFDGKLSSHATSDPFFSKYNGFVGDSSRSNRMLLNLLPTMRGQSGLSLSTAFWDSSEQAAVNLDEDPDVNIYEPFTTIQKIDLSDEVLRYSWADYEINKEPIEVFKSITYVDLCSSEGGSFAMDISHEDRAIEMDLEQEKEQIHSALDNATYSTTSTPNNNYWSHDSGIGSWCPSQKCPAPSVSLENLEACKLNFYLSDDKGYDDDLETSMKGSVESVRKYTDDLQPEDDTRYDSSYHPTDLIKSFYAGPSHCKLMKRRHPPKQKIKSISRKKLTKLVTINGVMTIENYSNKITEEDVCMRRIQGRKSLLPLAFNISRNIFDLYENASSDNRIRGITQEEQISREFIKCDNSFIESESYDGDHDDFMNCTEQGSTIPTSSEGFGRFGRSVFIPEASIIIQKGNRKVDIKKIRKISMLVFENEINLAPPEIKFNVVCTKVSKLCENSCDTSCALIFLSLLQEAAEKKISLSQTETLSDFVIKPYPTDHCMTN